MKPKTTLALILGAVGFMLPLLLPLETLSFAGQLTMGIFLMAAIFWVMEPIPIYATSMLVILLQILLLSAQGPLHSMSQPALVQPTSVASGQWKLPLSSLSTDQEVSSVYQYTADRFSKLEVQLVEQTEDAVIVQSAKLSSETEVVVNARHWRVGFQPPSYTTYLNTLASPIIILFLGGFVLAAGAVKYKLDRNLIRIILRPFGTRPGSVVFGLMAVTALLSAFMSNTATTAMMMAVIFPILASVPEGDRFRIGLVLCVPFAANIGGIATPIGTPPNAIALNALAERGVAIPFTSWMMLTIPLVLVMLVFIWVLVTRFFPCTVRNLPLDLKGAFDRSGKALALYIVFGLTILLWVTEALHGISSSMIAFMPVALLPALGVIEKPEIRNLPWEVLWLMAGGIALGAAMRETGLAAWMVNVVPWDAMGPLGILAAFGLVAILLATFIANTVAATLLMPLVMSLVSSGIASGFAMQTAALTVAIGASLGMALPISTPPNAIAMSTGLINTASMARMGVLIGIAGYGVLLLLAVFLWNNIF